ncbi:30S ribosomal protein S1 [Alicyclobacillus sp. SO9]|uniref:30S ribosomal protein S1 n=1 Tax=Alicyclobacillus sp. SO9 TaxID=2665646 RepID=UPI0018E8580F|nr:30S ribosomal protein S1 [Alicyclobacillus sp. SO9]QQE76828.1 30S ribosomal protein S1 [Alicyclobacillus sp. SO9]
MSEDISEMMNTSTVEPGDVVTGTVTEVEEKKVTVDIGYKFAGIIPIRELSVLRIDHPSEVVNTGDEVRSKVLKVDDESEVVILSKREADAADAWGDLQNKFESGEMLEVVIKDVVKGGLVADLGVRAFIPASLVDRHFVEDLEEFKGKTIRARVIEIDPENNKLVLSRKAVLDDEHHERVENVLHDLHEGQVVEGTVQRLTNFGAFVDVGGVDGLVHISELAWHHVDDPSEVVKAGDHVKVTVLRVDPEAGRISLSMKEAAPSPWDEYTEEFQEGDIVEGEVKRLVDFGAFVELKPGLEGLVHVSQISQQHVAHPEDALSVGDKVNVKILSFEPERKRVSLSIKDAVEDKVPSNKETDKFMEKQNDGPGTGATLGDLFGDLFNKH